MPSYYGFQTNQDPLVSALQKKRKASAAPAAAPMPAMPSISQTQPVTPVATPMRPVQTPKAVVGSNVNASQYSTMDPMAAMRMVQQRNQARRQGVNTDLTGMTDIQQQVALGNNMARGAVQLVNPARYNTTINGRDLSPEGAAGLQMTSAERAQQQNEALLTGALGQINAPGGTSEQYPEAYWDLRRREAAEAVRARFQPQLDAIDQEVRNGASPLWARQQRANLQSQMSRGILTATAEENNRRFEQTEQARMDRARVLAGMGTARPYQETSYTNMADWLHGMGIEDTQMNMAIGAYNRAMQTSAGGGGGGGGGGGAAGVPANQAWENPVVSTPNLNYSILGGGAGGRSGGGWNPMAPQTGGLFPETEGPVSPFAQPGIPTVPKIAAPMGPSAAPALRGGGDEWTNAPPDVIAERDRRAVEDRDRRVAANIAERQSPEGQETMRRLWAAGLSRDPGAGSQVLSDWGPGGVAGKPVSPVATQRTPQMQAYLRMVEAMNRRLRPGEPRVGQIGGPSIGLPAFR